MGFEVNMKKSAVTYRGWETKIPICPLLTLHRLRAIICQPFCKSTRLSDCFCGGSCTCTSLSMPSVHDVGTV